MFGYILDTFSVYSSVHFNETPIQSMFREISSFWYPADQEAFYPRDIPIGATDLHALATRVGDLHDDIGNIKTEIYENYITIIEDELFGQAFLVNISETEPKLSIELNVKKYFIKNFYRWWSDFYPLGIELAESASDIQMGPLLPETWNTGKRGSDFGSIVWERLQELLD